MNREIFALDIGTRKVMGIVARQTDEEFEIIDAEMVEHASRPMFDGQIHSIEEVSYAVKKIKGALELRLNKKLNHVGVAVAGRNLLTLTSVVTREFAVHEEITTEIVKDLELEAVHKIIIDSSRDLHDFYCVGYSPVYYELNGSRIASLIGHKASRVSAEVIVTFLPRIVLDSMFSVLKRCGLEATNITLEPIAAINAIVPPEMRTLNIILVDIGAGTSDLALTKGGTIFAYGMVPVAGDEITEAISEHFLVDFSTAEKIKRSVSEKPEIECEDIWGRKRIILSSSIYEVITPAVYKLASSVAVTGKELNGGIPQAVVAVGGGSLTPYLVESLAKNFGLPLDRVGIRLPEAIKKLNDRTGKLSGPESVTPLGIAFMTTRSQGLRFIEVTVNRKRFTLLDFEQKKDVMGALTVSGVINRKKLYPRPGMALSVEINGELKIFKGTLGEPAKILRNGKPVESLSDRIEDKDVIEFVEAIDGKDASVTVKSATALEAVTLVVNGQPTPVFPRVMMNDVPVDLDMSVSDRAHIQVMQLTAYDAVSSLNVRHEGFSERQILVNINGVPNILTQSNFSLRVNNQPASLKASVKKDDVIHFQPDKLVCYRIRDIIDIPDENKKINISVNERPLELYIEPVQIFMNGMKVKPEEFLIDGADIRVYYAKEQAVLLSEVFKYISVDAAELLGKKITIFLNDEPAGFTSFLSEGSRVRIMFEQRESNKYKGV